MITASSKALTQRHFEGVGAGDIPVVVKDLENTQEFAETILRYERTAMELYLIKSELLGAAKQLIVGNQYIKSIILECTDLPPYASKLQQELKLPVFDIMTLTRMANVVVVRTPNNGLAP